MGKDTDLFEKDLSATIIQTMEQIGGAIENYLYVLQKSLSALPWRETDLNKKMKSYAEQNVATASEFVKKLTYARSKTL